MGYVDTVFSIEDLHNAFLTGGTESKHGRQMHFEGLSDARLLLQNGTCVLKSAEMCLQMRAYPFLCHHYAV